MLLLLMMMMMMATKKGRHKMANNKSPRGKTSGAEQL